MLKHTASFIRQGVSCVEGGGVLQHRGPTRFSQISRINTQSMQQFIDMCMDVRLNLEHIQ